MLRNAIATISLGQSSVGHGIIEKIKQTKLARFAGFEIFFECLEAFACELCGESAPASREALLAAAGRVHKVREVEKVTAVSLRPFLFSEGLVDERARLQNFEFLELWFELAHILNTDVIQIPFKLLGRGHVQRHQSNCFGSHCCRRTRIATNSADMIRFRRHQLGNTH